MNILRSLSVSELRGTSDDCSRKLGFGGVGSWRFCAGFKAYSVRAVGVDARLNQPLCGSWPSASVACSSPVAILG